MVRLSLLIFGYRRLRAEEGQGHRLASVFIKLGMPAQQIAKDTFLVSESDFRRFRKYAGGRVRYTAGEPQGALPYILSFRKHIPTLVAVLAGIIFNIFLSGLVWDVRISGNERVSEGEITSALSESGVSIGTAWSSVDTAEAEAELLSRLPDVAWIHINRKGTVAYIELTEKAPTEPPDKPQYPCSNIVADRDCIIEEITVESGAAAVKAGDVVRKGDVLISGIVKTEQGTLFTYAKGTVIARAPGSISVKVSNEEQITEQDSSTLIEKSISVLGLSVNIFKNYRNLGVDYDIIENNKDIILFGQYKLPITYTEKYAATEISTSIFYSDSELPTLAAMRFSEELSRVLADKDLISIRTLGKYVESGYEMAADYVYATDVGDEVEVKISKELEGRAT